MVRPFVVARAVDGGLDWAGLKPEDVTGFVLSICKDRSIGSARLAVTALRSLLRYLHIEGLIATPMAAVIPPLAGSKLAGSPRSAARRCDFPAHPRWMDAAPGAALPRPEARKGRQQGNRL